MTISATIDQGPVMIYFGQEVGEPGRGAEGFQGDDGRTTIFDYWGVPEHQKWMNKGKFNDSLLSDQQKNLRSFYARLLNLSTSNTAISNGSYADITGHNIQAGNFRKDVHAFIRFTDEEKLLIINSFNDSPAKIKVEVPSAVMDSLKLNGLQTYTLNDLLSNQLVASLVNASVELDLKPYSSFIFKLQ
jgi:hypothetical protein